ncbi:MAG: hypothetical protein WD231_00665 [Candidatus Woykebacteria bacterium]
MESAQDIIDEAKKVLYGNLKTGYSKWAKTNYKYFSPSRHHYIHQWFWDSCFHAIVLSHFDIELAKNEIRSLLKVQRKDGFIPHVIYWRETRFRRPLAGIGAALESKFSLNPTMTELTQPPLIAQAVEAIYKKEKDLKFLIEVVPKLAQYYKWLAKNRDPDGDGLISIIAPYESGLDQSPSYDPILGLKNKNIILIAVAGRSVTFKNMLRGYNLEKIFADDYFSVEDVFVNSIYLFNLKLMTKLLMEVDREEEARWFNQKYNFAKKALVEKCFDQESKIFFDLYSKDEKKADIITIKSLMPLILDLDRKYVNFLVQNHILNSNEFNLPYPVPTVARSERSFAPAPSTIAKEPVIWRGPTWVNTNWYIAKGLAKHGFKKEAKNIADKTVELVKRSGFREFFDPFTGEGYGAHSFGWSTLVVDMIEEFKDS